MSEAPLHRAAAAVVASLPWGEGPLGFKAHRLVYHSTLGLRAIQKKKKVSWVDSETGIWARADCGGDKGLHWSRKSLRCTASVFVSPPTLPV